MTRPGQQRGQPSGYGRMAEELDLLTEVAVTGQADVALPTRVGRLDDDALALPGPGGDNTTEFVSEDKRVAHPILTNTAVLKPVQIRAAETDGSDADQVLPRTRNDVRFCMQPDVAGTVKTQYFHALHDSDRRRIGYKTDLTAGYRATYFS